MKQLTDVLPLPKPIASPANELLMTVMYAARTLSGAAQALLREHTLTEAQFNALMLLEHQFPAGASQVELSRCLVVNKANVTGLVDRMVRDGLVQRDPDPKDRRAHIVRMTADGQRRLAAAATDYNAVLDQILEEIAPAQIRKQIEDLLKLSDHVLATRRDSK